MLPSKSKIHSLDILGLSSSLDYLELDYVYFLQIIIKIVELESMEIPHLGTSHFC